MSFIKIAIIVVLCLSIGVNLFAYILEKVYKKKMLKNFKKDENE